MLQNDININRSEFKIGTDLTILSIRVSCMLKMSFQISRGRKNSLKNWVGATDYICKEKNSILHYKPR